jgi:sulfoxide reductase heme-binding subunit YedZ
MGTTLARTQTIAGKLPWNDKAGRFAPLKATTLVLVALPMLWLLYRALFLGLGARPITEAIHRVGDWTVYFLLITLAVTPARRLLDWPKLIQVRRILGLSALAWILVHFTLYVVDSKLDLAFVAKEIALRVYLAIGFTALLGLIALGLTSTDGMIRRLGSGRWQRLHNLVYLIACLGLFHFALQAKIDVTQPVLLSGLFALLMAYRGLARLGIPFSATSLTLTALGTGLVTALAETAWYAFATGASAWLIFQANADIVVYRDWTALRPGHWVALVGLALALLHVFRKPSPKPEPIRRHARA